MVPNQKMQSKRSLKQPKSCIATLEKVSSLQVVCVGLSENTQTQRIYEMKKVVARFLARGEIRETAE